MTQLVEEAFVSAVTVHASGQKQRSTHHQSLGTPHVMSSGMSCIEVEDAGAERGVRAGVVIVEGAVRIDEVQVHNLALELLQQLKSTARRRSGSFADGRAHRGHVAGVVECAEVAVAEATYRVYQSDDLAWLVDWKTGLKLPANRDAVLGRDLRAFVERVSNVEQQFRLDADS